MSEFYCYHGRRIGGIAVKNIDVLTHPDHYFKKVVEEALKNQNLKTQEEVEFYLVNLLSHFMQTENLFPYKAEHGLEQEPLALKFHKAMNDERLGQKVRLLKETGDFSLYISGFFSESLSRSVVDTNYYIGMGEAAYKNLSLVMPEKVFQSIFEELALKFTRFVDILAEISLRTNLHNNQSVLQLYEKWMSTKSPGLLKLLHDKGIIPLKSEDDPKTS